jgi:hypothetical protein
MATKGKEGLDSIKVPAREVYVESEVEVLVIGGGPAGFAAALAAARSGARTALVERYAVLGGMWTVGGVDQLNVRYYLPGLFPGEDRPVLGGIAQELLDELVKIHAAYPAEIAWKHRISKDIRYTTWMPIDTDLASLLLLRMLTAAGVALHLHSWFSEPILEEGEVRGAIIETKSGRQAIRARIVIDATADADVAARAGCPYEQDARMGRMTMVSYWTDVDLEQLKTVFSLTQISELLEQAIAAGELPEPEAHNYSPVMQDKFKRLPYVIGIRYQDPPPEWKGHYTREREVRFWGPHYGSANATDAADLTRAEVESRVLYGRFHDWAKRSLPGFQDAYMNRLIPQIGIRESRRIKGSHVLTGEEVQAGADFEDSVARGIDQVYIAGGYGGAGDEVFLPPHGIPYRCLVPLHVENLLVAGRCISIDSAAAKMYSPRETPSCMATGQAAGVAAALSIEAAVPPSRLDVAILQRSLVSQGVNLGQRVAAL